jgi:hypothetical protein
MKFQCENDPEWLTKCSIEPRYEYFIVKMATGIIPALIEPRHALHAQIKAEYERRQKGEKK